MATAIERLYKVSVDGGEAIRQLNKIADSTKNVDKQIQDFTKGFSDFKNKVLAGITFATVIAGFKSLVDSISEVADTSQKLGIAASELQKLRFAAGQSGVSAEALNTGIKKLSVGLSEIGDNTSEAGKQLRSLGVTSGDTVTTALKKISDKFKDASDGAGKTAVAVKGLGKSGNELIPLLNAGSEGLEKMAKQAERLGLVLDDKTVDLFEAFGDQLDIIEKTSKVAGTQLAAGLVPALSALADAFIEAKDNGEGFRGIGAGLGDAAIFLAEQFIKVFATVKQFAAGIGAAAAALVAFFSGDFSEAKTIILEFVDDTNKAGARAEEQIKKLKEGYQKYLKDGVEPAKKGTNELSAASVAQAKVIADLTFEYISLTKFLNETDKLYLKIRLGLVTYTEAQLKLAAAIARRKDEIETNKNIQKSYKDIFTEQDKQIEQLEKLIAVIDPSVKKTEEYADGLRILTEAFQSGLITSTEELDKRTQQLNDTFSGERERLKAVAAAYGEILQEQDKQIEQYQQLIETLDPLVKKNDDFAKGMEILNREYQAGRIGLEELGKRTKQLNDKFLEVNPVLKVVQDNFQAFFENLGRGTERAGELFKRMVQSIIAQLLRLAAQKAILAAFGIDIGATKAAKGLVLQDGNIVRRYAKGAVFDESGPVRKFAKGTILTSPVLFPMSSGLGQAGEAGSEGVFPLARTSSGDLGVKGISPTVNVNVINNTNSEVEVRQSEDGTRVDIIIDRAKRAVAADIRSGGGLVSSSIESTYALGRARGG